MCHTKVTVKGACGLGRCNFVMMSFMPGSLNEEGVIVNVNDQLTDLDKAFMVINYPKDVNPAAPEWTLEHALEVAEVSADTKKDILACRRRPDEVRSVFNACIKKSQKSAAFTKGAQSATSGTSVAGNDEITRLLQQIVGGSAPGPVGHALAPSGPPAGVERSIWSAITGVLKSPVFREIASNVVDVALSQRGLDPANCPGG